MRTRPLNPVMVATIALWLIALLGFGKSAAAAEPEKTPDSASTSTVPADRPTQSAQEKIDSIRKKYSTASGAAVDAQELLPYFKDSDWTVRHAAYATAMSASLSTPEQVFAVMDAAESDPDANARIQARNAWESLRVRPNMVFPGVDRVALPGLEKMALSGTGEHRLKAVVALGWVCADVANTYRKLLKDEDIAIRVAAIDAAARMLDVLQRESARTQLLGSELLSLLIEDPSVREAAGLAVYKLTDRLAGPNLDELLSKLDRSKSLDERAIAAVTRCAMVWAKPDWGVTREHLAEGMRSRYAWVRTVATWELFRTRNDNGKLSGGEDDGRPILIAAVSDPNPDVAHDAALRLCGALPVGFANITYARAAAELRETSPRVQRLPPNTPGLDSKNPQERLQALTALGKERPLTGVILATRLFADRDPQVARAARETAIQLIEKSGGSRRGNAGGSSGKPNAAVPIEKLGANPAAAQEFRTFQDVTGKFKIEGRFIALEPGRIRIKTWDDRTLLVPLEKLSAEDQQWVRRQATAQSDAGPAPVRARATAAEAKAKAIAAIESLGGEVTFDEKNADRPVISVRLRPNVVSDPPFPRSRSRNRIPPYVGDDVVEHLAALNGLQSLDLSHTAISDAGLQDLVEVLTDIKSLDLSFCSVVTNWGVEHLTKLTALQTLNLSHIEVTDAGLQHLQGLTNLKALDLSWTQVTGEGLAQLHGLTNLQTLNLGGGRLTDAGLGHLKGFTHLQTLILEKTQITDAGLDHLKGLTSLQNLYLPFNISDAGLENLERLTALQSLDLRYTRVTDAGLEHLKGLSNLQSLTLWGTNVTDSGLERLKALTKLRLLNLSHTKVTDTGLDCLKGLTRLESLDLSHNFKVTDGGLERLTRLANLQSLNVEYTGVTDGGMAKLRQALPKCKIDGTPDRAMPRRRPSRPLPPTRQQ